LRISSGGSRRLGRDQGAGMNDKPAATESAAFDLASAGWKPVKPIGFGELVGPIWRLGDARFGVVVEARHLNFADIVHGGLLMTLADQAMGMTALRATDNKPHATIELNMQFVGAVRLGEFVEAHCEIVRITRAIIFMHCKLVVGDRGVANATGIWKIRGEG
jgi:uncharacterized protein (TIGR00369 family)